jgi:tetratricopeptide (TPR) repeat protein
MRILGEIFQKNSFPNRSRVFALFILILLAGGLYLNSLGNIFTNWDDGMIYSNTEVRSISLENILTIFTLKKAATYQPVRVLSYAVDYHFWKLNPLGYHITNIFFYILTCIMVLFILRLLSAGLRQDASPNSHWRAAVFGALLFAAHPVHVEAVTWLAARKEVLQGFFFFSAFYLYLKGRDTDGKKRFICFALVFLSFLLAALSKPSAVVFPAVILIYELATRREGLKRFIEKHWVFLISSLGISGVFIFILFKVMFEAGGIKAYRGATIASNVLVCIYAFLENIKSLLLTINYSAAYSFAVSMPVFCLKNIILILVTVSLFAVSILSLRRTKVIFFSLFFFLVTLLPYLNIIPISTLKADRYVFIASLSYTFILGIVFEYLYVFRHKKFSEGFFKLLSMALLIFLLVGYSLITIHQNTIWENSYTLWADAVEKQPNSNTANALMGVVYLELGMDRDAAKYLERAVQLLPYDYESRNNLGIVYGRLGEPEKALNEFATAISLRPNDDTIKINLSVFYQRQKEYEKAEKILRYLSSKNAKNAQLHFRLGLLYKDAGHCDKAVSEFLKSTELTPDIINPYVELGNLYASRMNNSEKAKHYYTKGIEAAPKAKSRIQDLRWMVHDLECHQ